MRYLPVLILVLFSCNYMIDKPDAPVDLIQKDKMVLLLKDLSKLEAYTQQKYSRVDNFYKALDRSGEALLKENSVSADQFSRSLEYYAADQEELKEMYDEALNLLNEELGSIQENNH